MTLALPVRMRRLVIFGWLLSLPLSVTAESGLATSCPAYPTHLVAARAALVRGDRTTAASELRNARAALESCLREEAAGHSLLALQDTGHHRQ